MDVRQLRTLFYSLFKESSLVGGGGLDGLGRSVCSGIAAAALSLSRMPARPLTPSSRSPPLPPFGMVATIDFLSLSSHILSLSAR